MSLFLPADLQAVTAELVAQVQDHAQPQCRLLTTIVKQAVLLLYLPASLPVFVSACRPAGSHCRHCRAGGAGAGAPGHCSAPQQPGGAVRRHCSGDGRAGGTGWWVWFACRVYHLYHAPIFCALANGWVQCGGTAVVMDELAVGFLAGCKCMTACTLPILASPGCCT